MNPTNLLAVDSGIMIKANSADESIVKGVNKLTLPGLMRKTVESQEFRTDFDIKFTTSGSWDDVKYSGNAYKGDTKGQDQLKQYLIDNEKFTDARIYFNMDDFVAPDIANDANTGFQVINHQYGDAGKDNLIPFNGSWATGGRLAWFMVHQVDGAVPTMDFPAGGTTITDSGSGFVDAGFEIGQTLIIEGSTSNDGQYLITAVAAGTITCAAASFNVEPSIEGMTLHGGKL